MPLKRLPFSWANRSDWVNVLEYMYENEITTNVGKRGWMSAQEAATLANSLQMYSNVETDGNIDYALDKLEGIGLIEGDDFEVPVYSLTREGFQFAHQLKAERQRQMTNLILVIFTFVLVLLTIILVA